MNRLVAEPTLPGQPAVGGSDIGPIAGVGKQPQVAHQHFFKRLSLASAWLGLCIATIVQTWEFMKHVRKLVAGMPHTASLGVQ